MTIRRWPFIRSPPPSARWRPSVASTGAGLDTAASTGSGAVSSTGAAGDAGDAGFSPTVRLCFLLHPLRSIVLLYVLRTAATVREEVVVCMLQPSTDWARLFLPCARVRLVYSGVFGQGRADGRRASRWAAGERAVRGRAGDRSARKNQESLQDEPVGAHGRGDGGGGASFRKSPREPVGGNVRSVPRSRRERTINHQSPCNCNRSRKCQLHGRFAAGRVLLGAIRDIPVVLRDPVANGGAAGGARGVRRTAGSRRRRRGRARTERGRGHGDGGPACERRCEPAKGRAWTRRPPRGPGGRGRRARQATTDRAPRGGCSALRAER